MQTLRKQYKVASQAVKVATEKMNIIELNTENGQLSASDFNEANLELSQAQLRQKQILPLIVLGL
ncbi:MAG: TolC family protein [Candidatus Heimdallarchaeota archaeon]